MQATPHGEKVVQSTGRLLVGHFMKRDQRVSFCTESSGVLESKLVLKFSLFSLTIIPLLARNLAGATTDTLGYIDQCRFDRNRGCRLRHDMPLR